MHFAAWCVFGLLCFLLLDHLFFLGIRETAFQWYQHNERGQDPLLTNLRRNDYDMLIMGSSRSCKALLPIHFHELLKRRPLQVSLKVKYPKYNYHFYSRYRRISKPPALVLYGVDFHLFSIQSWNLLMQKLFVDDPGISRFPLPRFSSGNLIADISWLAAAKPEIERFMQDFISSHTDSRVQSGTISTYLGQSESRVRSFQPPRFRRIPYTPFPGIEGEYLVRLLDMFQQDGVKVFMVILPDYIGTYHTLHGRKRYYQDIQDLCDRFEHVTCMNFHDPSAFDIQNADCFNDGGWGSGNSHLSSRGARRLAEIICERIAAEAHQKKTRY